MSRAVIRSVLAGLVAMVAFAGLGVVRPNAASAHPLGNFTVSTATRIELYADAIRVHYAVDMAEIPAFQELADIDTDGDGAVSAAEREAYLGTTVPALIEGLSLTSGSERLAIEVLGAELALLPGEGGLDTLRIDLVLDALPVAGGVAFEDTNYAERLGWREVTLVAGEGVPLDRSDVPASSPSSFLTAYPEASDASGTRITAASFAYVPGEGELAPPFEAGVVHIVPAGVPGGFGSILDGRPLTLTVVLVMLLVAMGFGAVHALEPGHGKTIVAAYFVGANGRASHAALLGLIVAATHSVGVLAIGALTLYGTRYVRPEDLYPWLTLVSGVMVVALGAGLLASRLSGNHYLRHLATGHLIPHRHTHGSHGHDHAHDHGHAHPHSHDHAASGPRRWQPPAKYRPAAQPPASIVQPRAAVPWKSLTVLGLIDGLIPTPSTLVVLLSAISVGQFALGMALVVAFSVGLAAVLSSISLVTIVLKGAAARFQRRHAAGSTVARAIVSRAATVAPAVAALALIVTGSVVVLRATSGTLL